MAKSVDILNYRVTVNLESARPCVSDDAVPCILTTRLSLTYIAYTLAIDVCRVRLSAGCGIHQRNENNVRIDGNLLEIHERE